MAIPLKHTSTVWNHFQIKHDDDTKATCLYCDASISRGSKAISSKGYTTTNMWKHVKRYHEEELDADTPSTSTTDNGPQPKKQATLEHVLEKQTIYDADDLRTKAVTQIIAEQMCLDMERFDLVNKQGFQRTIKQLCPEYKMASRPHISENVIPDMYCRVKNKIKNLLQQLPHITITTDLWTSDAASSVNDFISLTAHGLDNNFDLKTYCLEVFPFEGENHSSESIAQNLRTLFQDWNIDEQVRAVVTDNAPNMGLAVTQVGVDRIRCMTHSLQSVVNDAVFEVAKIDDMIKMARSIIGQDVSTRWDSTLQALRIFKEQRVPIQSSFPLVKCETELAAEEWTLLEQVVSTLTYFEEATKYINEESACLSDAIPMINSLRRILEQIKDQQIANNNDNDNPEYSAFVESLIVGINDRFRYLEGEEIFILATILDPRYKSRTFALQSTVIQAKKALLSIITNTDRDIIESQIDQHTIFTGIWKACEDLIKETEGELLSKMYTRSEQEELESYLRCPNIPRTSDVKNYWRCEKRYPNLKRLAQKYLSYRMSSVASERFCSTTGLVQNDLRKRLSASNLNKICFLNKNLSKVRFNY